MTHSLKALFAWALVFSAAFAEEPRYTNPVLAGDYPDPSIVRVGDEYWATATSSEWGPQYPILHSRDLVNWEIVGNVFPERPTWAIGNFWAPELSYDNGKYYVYYVARNQKNLLAIGVATADAPTGPYTDHGELIAQDAGSIDAMPFTDKEGQRWLVWKEDGNSRQQPTPIWLQRLSEDGLRFEGEPKEILRNDVAWEGQVVEGPFIFTHDDWYYLIYAGGACCGRECSYGVGVARARDIQGPWGKCPANPIVGNNSSWRCPGHGSVVQDSKGRYWFFYHAYATGTFVLTGREMVMDEITWGSDGWPRINDGSPSVTGAAPLGVASKSAELKFHDSFESDTVAPGWLWPQEQIPIRSTNSGDLVLQAPEPVGEALLGAVLARSCTSGDYVATTTVDLSDIKGQGMAGIAAIGDFENGIGLAVNKKQAVIWQRRFGEQDFPIERPIEAGDKIQLRLSVKNGDQMTFAYSTDGNKWTNVGKDFDGSYLPPWDRNVRVGLTVGRSTGATARFEEFTLESTRSANKHGG